MLSKILERVELKGFNKYFWRKIGQAMMHYEMLEAGDRVAVAISGGKDSIALFNAFLRLKELVNFDFEIVPVHVYNTDLDFSGFEEVEKYIASYGYKIEIIKINIGKILDEKKVGNPCSLCSRMRRGLLYTFMKENTCNKLALGHHLDDIIETYFMNMLYQGNSLIMRPIYHSEEHGVTIIRPMAYVEESQVKKYIRKGQFPTFKDNCRYIEFKKSSRDSMKQLIFQMESLNPTVRSSIKNALGL